MAQQLDPQRLRWVTRHLRNVVDPEGALDAANREYARRSVYLSQTLGGGFVLNGDLDAEGGALLRTALEALQGRSSADGLSAAQRRADALVELARRQLQNGALPSAHGARPHLSVTVPVAALRGGASVRGGELAWAGPVVGELVRRLACDASVTEISVAGEGGALDAGRRRRTVPPSMRHALVNRDHGCRFPGCDRPPEWTDAHHIEHWADGGATRLDNLVLLCRRHHRQVHEERWRLRHDEAGAVVVVPP